MSSGAIDPEIGAARARQAQSGAPFDITALPPAEGRARADAAALFFNDGTPALDHVETLTIPGPGSDLRVRVYRGGDAARGALYLHGGGWVTCNVDTHDSIMRRLALECGGTIVGVDQRLAPEHPFPAPLHDAIAAWRWLNSNAAALKLDPARLGVVGDSGGANLALALSLSERDAGQATPRAGALFYGAFAPRFDTPSHARNGDGRFGLTTERMRWYWRQYLGGVEPTALSAPLMADLQGLAPHYLCLAELDPIADDTRQLIEQMQAAKVEIESDEWLGAVHGFMQMGRDVALAREAIAKAGDFLKRRL